MGIFLRVCYNLRNFAFVQFDCKPAIKTIWVRRYINRIIRTNINHNGGGWIDRLVIVLKKDNQLQTDNSSNPNRIRYCHDFYLYCPQRKFLHRNRIYIGRSSRLQYYSHFAYQL